MGEPVQVVVLVIAPVARAAVDGEQTAGGELAQHPNHSYGRHGIARDDLPDQCEPDLSVEHRQAAEHRRLVIVELQVAATRDRAQRIVSDWPHLGQVLDQVTGWHRSQLCGDQFQRERQATATAAQCDQVPGTSRIHRQRSTSLADPVQQQAHLTVVSQPPVPGLAVVLVRGGERNEWQQPFPFDPQRDPTGGQHGYLRGIVDQRVDERGRSIEHGFAAVQHQQHPAQRREVGTQGRDRIICHVNVQRQGHRRGQQRLIGHRSQ